MRRRWLSLAPILSLSDLNGVRNCHLEARPSRRHTIVIVTAANRGTTRTKGEDGIVVPTKRRVCTSDANKQKILEAVLVAIDIRDIAFGA
jgi:hypothetical protein